MPFAQVQQAQPATNFIANLFCDVVFTHISPKLPESVQAPARIIF